MKPVAILLHGALGAEQQLFPLKELLSEAFHVYTLNFTGHGGKSFDNDFGIQKFSKDLISLLDKEELKNVNIFGYSMGGYVALTTASEDSRISKIYTLGTKFAWSPETASHEVKMLNPEKIEEKVPAFAKALEARHVPEDWKLVLKNTASMMLSLGDTPLLTDQNLKAINTPVIISHGTEDNMVSEEESKRVAGLLPNAHFKSHEGFKHPIEQGVVS
jgi:pimeloyl-ACP methyl ester carboxylesterase